MRTCYKLIFFASVFTACTHKNRIPGDILPQQKMAGLVWDVMTADEYAKEVIATDSIRGKNLKMERSVLYQQVFDLHHVNRGDFVKSFNYYASHPDLTKILFDTLATRANTKREEAFHLRERK